MRGVVSPLSLLALSAALASPAHAQRGDAPPAASTAATALVHASRHARTSPSFDRFFNQPNKRITAVSVP